MTKFGSLSKKQESKMNENKREEIKKLKNLLFEKYGIALNEDDPAWMMVLIYNDLLMNTNKALDELNHIPIISSKNEENLKSINALQKNAKDTLENLLKYHADITKERADFYKTTSKNMRTIIGKATAEIDKIESATKKAVNLAIADITIDTSIIDKAIDKKIENIDLSELADFIKDTNENIREVKTGITNDIHHIKEIKESWDSSLSSLENIPQQINDTTEALNKKIASLGWGRFFTGLLIGGMFTGGIVYINAHSIYHGMFSEKEVKLLKGLEDDRQMLLEETHNLDEEYSKTADMIKTLNHYGIKIRNLNGKKYISVKTYFGEKGIIYNYSNKYSFIQIDD